MRFCKSFFASRDENTLGFVPMNSLAATAGATAVR